jgi:hypothetical protein
MNQSNRYFGGNKHEMPPSKFTAESRGWISPGTWLRSFVFQQDDIGKWEGKIYIRLRGKNTQQHVRQLSGPERLHRRNPERRTKNNNQWANKRELKRSRMAKGLKDAVTDFNRHEATKPHTKNRIRVPI